MRWRKIDNKSKGRFEKRRDENEGVIDNRHRSTAQRRGDNNSDDFPFTYIEVSDSDGQELVSSNISDREEVIWR